MNARDRSIAASRLRLTTDTRDTSDRSISWRVNAERIVLLGWSRAILLQLAHPLVAAGVFDHSDFRSTPLATAARLHHTVRAMLSLTFGDEGRRERTLDSIRAIHRRVHGVLAHATGPYPAGTAYSAEDPALLLWVHATLIESVLLTYEQLVRPLTVVERNAYCSEARPIAVALGAREEEVPVTWGGLRDYLDDRYASGVIVVGTEGRALATAVLSPKGQWLIAPVAWAHRTITIGLLPEFMREQYALAWTRRHARSHGRLVSLLRSTRKQLPAAVALWPEARRRL